MKDISNRVSAQKYASRNRNSGEYFSKEIPTAKEHFLSAADPKEGGPGGVLFLEVPGVDRWILVEGRARILSVS